MTRLLLAALLLLAVLPVRTVALRAVSVWEVRSGEVVPVKVIGKLTAFCTVVPCKGWKQPR